jgi:Glyoxalase-like domain
MWESLFMQLDHVSYAVRASELADTIQRLGADLGAAFIDGGRHPSFGTRNFILPLSGGTYIEVVSALDHPASEAAPFGRAVRERAEDGGGWLGWVVAVDDLAPVESRLGRDAVPGHRVRPDGADLTWKQIGVLDLLDDPQLPYFIEWADARQHPSVGFQTPVKITEISMSGSRETLETWLGGALDNALDGVELSFVEDEAPGISAVVFQTAHGAVVID